MARGVLFVDSATDGTIFEGKNELKLRPLFFLVLQLLVILGSRSLIRRVKLHRVLAHPTLVLT